MYSLSGESKRTKVILFSLLAVFLFMCLFASFFYNEELLLGSFENYDNDDVRYLRSAETLLKTGTLTYKYPDIPTVFIMPGITFILAPFVALFGIQGAVIPIRIFFALLQTWNLFVVFILARKIFSSSKVALISVFISVLYLPNVYVSTLILTEAPSHTLFLQMLLFIISGSEKKKCSDFVVGGIFWGLLVLFRPTLAAFPLVVFFYWLMKKFKFAEMFKFALCALIPLVLLLSPWVIRNYMTFNRFIPLTLASGNPAMQGTIINYDPALSEEMHRIVNANDIDFGDDEIDHDAAETEIAKRIFDYNIKNNTLPYIGWYTLGKTYRNFNSAFCWYPIFFPSLYPVNILHYILLFTFIAGCIVAKKKKAFTPEIALLPLTVLFFNCIHLPFYCFSRYTYLIMALIVIFDAYIFCKLLRRKKTKQESL